jgi:hypothetical protein
MNQVIASYEFEESFGGLKLFWSNSGSMLGAGGLFFKFSFWAFPSNDKTKRKISSIATNSMKSTNQANFSDVLKNCNFRMEIR